MRSILVIALIISVLAILCASCDASSSPKGNTKEVRAKKVFFSGVARKWLELAPTTVIINVNSMYKIGDTVGIDDDAFFKYVIVN